MTDIVDRLVRFNHKIGFDRRVCLSTDLEVEAAAEIDRLRAEVDKLTEHINNLQEIVREDMKELVQYRAENEKLRAENEKLLRRSKMWFKIAQDLGHQDTFLPDIGDSDD